MSIGEIHHSICLQGKKGPFVSSLSIHWIIVCRTFTFWGLNLNREGQGVGYKG